MTNKTNTNQNGPIASLKEAVARQKTHFKADNAGFRKTPPVDTVLGITLVLHENIDKDGAENIKQAIAATLTREPFVLSTVRRDKTSSRLSPYEISGPGFDTVNKQFKLVVKLQESLTRGRKVLEGNAELSTERVIALLAATEYKDAPLAHPADFVDAPAKTEERGSIRT